MKRSEDGKGLVMRFYESAGKGGNVTLTVPPGATFGHVVNLMEKPEGSALSVTGDKVTVPVTPYEIQTVRWITRRRPSNRQLEDGKRAQHYAAPFCCLQQPTDCRTLD